MKKIVLNPKGLKRDINAGTIEKSPQSLNLNLQLPNFKTVGHYWVFTPKKNK